MSNTNGRKLFSTTLSCLDRGEKINGTLIRDTLTLFVADGFRVIDPLLLNDHTPSVDLGLKKAGGETMFWVLPVHHPKLNHWSIGIADGEYRKISYFDSIPKLNSVHDFRERFAARFGRNDYAWCETG